MRFVQARNYTSADRGRGDVSWIVLHSMEMPETINTAERCAEYFANTTRQASAHYCVDNNSIVQCVALHDVAWAAPGANSRGIQIELSGYANQSHPQWLDNFGIAMLRLAAEHVASLCKAYQIPMRYIDREGLLGGRPGITTHHQVSQAFKRSTHYDPGPHFPINQFCAMVNTFGKDSAPVVTPGPSNLIRLKDGTSFFTFFPRWSPITLGSRFWAQTIALQFKLNGYQTATGHRALVLDGKFGQKSYDFLKAYQYWKGLPQDGIAHPNDARSLGLIR